MSILIFDVSKMANGPFLGSMSVLVYSSELTYCLVLTSVCHSSGHVNQPHNGKSTSTFRSKPLPLPAASDSEQSRTFEYVSVFSTFCSFVHERTYAPFSTNANILTTNLWHQCLDRFNLVMVTKAQFKVIHLSWSKSSSNVYIGQFCQVLGLSNFMEDSYRQHGLRRGLQKLIVCYTFFCQYEISFFIISCNNVDQ